MKLKIIHFILCIIISITCYGQELNVPYLSFADDERVEHQITFRPDSIAIIEIINPNIKLGFFITFANYKITSESIIVEIEKFDNNQFKSSEKFGLSYLSDSRIVLNSRNNEWLDIKNKVVYVNESVLAKHQKKGKSLTIIDGKKYQNRIKMNSTNSIIKNSKTRFEKKLHKIADSIHLYNIERVKGITGYLRYGLMGVNGVTIIKKKEGISFN